MVLVYVGDIMAAPKGNCLNPDGRPRKEFNWDEFEQMCAWHCTQSEIASFFKVHIDTLRDAAQKHYKDDYSNIYKKYQEAGKCSLRRNQYVMSATNATMSIWLGKQYLGQKDTPQDNVITEEILKPFTAIMNQIASLQSSNAKIEDNSNSSDCKS